MPREDASHGVLQVGIGGEQSSAANTRTAQTPPIVRITRNQLENGRENPAPLKGEERPRYHVPGGQYGHVPRGGSIIDVTGPAMSDEVKMLSFV